MAVTTEKENCSRKINGNIPALSLNSDNMSTSTDSDDVADPTYEIRNIQSIINVTRENIDALNAKFAGFQQPPSLYLSEYHELTSKLHNLELRERTLRELLQEESPDRSEECSLQDDSKKFDTLTRQPKVFLRAHLPNQQRTSVQVKDGVTLRDALSKALKLRNLTCEMCEVVRTGYNQVIPWDIDITLIDAEEVSVVYWCIAQAASPPIVVTNDIGKGIILKVFAMFKNRKKEKKNTFARFKFWIGLD